MNRSKRRLPPPNWLRAFEAAARHLSFTAAARELHVTQSAVSQQVRLLEQYLNEPLFLRHPRKLALTDTGSAYLVSVHEAFDRLARSTDELFGDRHTERVTLRTNAAFAVYWLAPRLAEFQSIHPEIELRISMSVWLAETVWEAVSLEVRHGSGVWPGLFGERLTWDELTPMCSPSLLEGPLPLNGPADLAQHRALRVLGNNDDWNRWMESAGVPDLEPAEEFQCDSSVIALEYAAAGGGIALGHTDFCGELLASKRLVAPFDIACDATDAFYLVSPQNRADTTAAGALRTWLMNSIRGAKRDAAE
jgi:LysR family transcriptional regulator, glycine cleavage system transcriptional activator